MAIIVEGIDNSGKSTLATSIADALQLDVVEGEGPPKSVDEINSRVARYAELRRVVFVRHPCVSNPIYDQARPLRTRCIIEPHHYANFYTAGHLFIYCDPLNRALDGHVVKDERDTPEHLRQVEDHYCSLLGLYRQWAIERAHVLYRIGDSVERVLKICSIVG